MRYGLMTNTRRSWSRVGARAAVPCQQAFINSYLYSAVAPLTGKSFHLLLPAMESDLTLLFLHKLKELHPDEHVVVVWDNAPCHRRADHFEIEGVTIINLPPYSPQLNPSERFFEELRRGTANSVFDDLASYEEVITAEINRWCDDPAAMQDLLGYGWIKEQWKEVN